MSKKKIVYPFNLCKMKVNIGTGARYLQKILNISKPKDLSIINLNSGFAGGTAFKGVLRLRVQLRVPRPTAFKNFGGTAFKNLPLLRLRIYRIT